MTRHLIDRVASPAKLEERRLRYEAQLQGAKEVVVARYAFGRLVDVEQEIARRQHLKCLLMARGARRIGDRAQLAHFLTLACEAREAFRLAGSARIATTL